MIIYKVTNKENNKVYIGKTVRELKVRKWAHYDSARNLNSETNFHRALMKYPKESFVWEIIGNANTEDKLNQLEIDFIKEYNSFRIGYNMSEGGTGGLTYKKGSPLYEKIKHKLGKWKNGNPGSTKEAIEKRKETFKNTDWISGENHGNYGHSHNKGILVGEKNPMYGKTPTNARKIEVNGVVYNSVTEACKKLNTHGGKIRKIGKYLN